MQVPLGVILKNENNLDEMISIVEELHKYVPTRGGEMTDPVTGKQKGIDQLHCLLFGGDQLTRKRIETAIELRQNSSSAVNGLKGVQPVCEDWHAKKCLMEVTCHIFI